MPRPSSPNSGKNTHVPGSYNDKMGEKIVATFTAFYGSDFPNSKR